MKTVATFTPAAQEPKVIRFGCHNTRRNLPAKSANKRGESNFLGAFERAYFATVGADSSAFARGREFGLNGYGRADLIWLAWNKKSDDAEFSALALEDRIQLTAIEAKLKDWRKGLAQTVRYRHFAHRSILVLPPAAANSALEYLPTFRALGVGLWAFDVDTGRITRHSTPRPSTPQNAQVYAKAVSAIMHGLKIKL